MFRPNPLQHPIALRTQDRRGVGKLPNHSDRLSAVLGENIIPSPAPLEFVPLWHPASAVSDHALLQWNYLIGPTD
jgi:hypothetical protein